MKSLLITAAALIFPMASLAQMAGHDAADMHHDKPPVPPSTSLTVTFATHSIALTLADLQAMPQVTVTVHNAHRNADESYSGPLLADVLTKAGLAVSKETEPIILHSTVTATATDNYFVVYSAAEVEPAFSTGKVIVAIAKSGAPDTEGGLIQLINTTDAKPARWVHGLSAVRVSSMSAVRLGTPGPPPHHP